MASLLLWSLFDSDKLVGSNFDSGYWKLKIILEHEKILYVLMDPTPKILISNAHDAVRGTYQKWLNDQTIVQCVMRVVMKHEFN